MQLSTSDCVTIGDGDSWTVKHEHEVRTKLYQSMIGCLLYVALSTRPDICHAVNELSRFLKSPGDAHLTAARRVMRYIRGTIGIGLEFDCAEYRGEQRQARPHDDKRASEGIESASVEVYVDANWGGDIETRKSTSGMIALVDRCLVYWNSKRQPTIALSSAESEYMAISGGVQQAIWIDSLLVEIGCRVPARERDRERVRDDMLEVRDPTRVPSTEVEAQVEVERRGREWGEARERAQERRRDPTAGEPVVMYTDSQSAKSLCMNGTEHARTKHIDIRHHFIREYLASGRGELVWVSSAEQLADIFTKSVDRVTFVRIRDIILGVNGAEQQQQQKHRATLTEKRKQE
jgi:hypothetical protein